MTVNVQVLNADAVLNSLRKRFESGLPPALEKTKELVETKFTNNPGGWVPLAAATLRDRRRKGFGSGPMLFRTGHLKGQAVQQTTIDGNTGTISTSDPMAILQNNGGGNIPARPFYKLSGEDRAAIVKAFFEGIK
jgi:phage gpG-like protein